MAQDQKQGIFITQEDIDTALGAAERSDGDAVPLFLSESDIVESEFDLELEEDEYFGLLSKDDIETLLHDGAESPEGKNVQDEIDSLVQSNPPEEDASAVVEEPPGEKVKAAQEDVDLLISDAMSGAEAETGEAPAETGSVSQDDIERLMSGALDGVEDGTDTGAAADTDGGEAAPETEGGISQTDIDSLLSGALDGVEDGAGTGTAADTDGGEAAPETEGGISQTDIDSLLSGAMEDDEGDGEVDFGGPASAGSEPKPEAQEESEGLISQSDLDQLMAGGASADLVEAAPSEDTTESPEESGELISQSDLDQLMAGGASADLAEAAPSEDTSTPSDHISQDDINRLLKESLDEEERPDDAEEDLPVEEEDLPGEAGIEAEDEDDLKEPVILAEDEAPVAPGPVSKSKPAKKIRLDGWKKRLGKRHLAVAMAAGIVLLVSVSFVVMSPGPKEAPPQPQVLTFSISQISQETSNAVVISTNSIHLPGFIVLAPANSAAVAYVTADLTLDFSDAAIVAVIKENEAFVRDIIYGTIRSEMMVRDINDIDEISLELAIRKALGQVVARESIERIAFERFSLV